MSFDVELCSILASSRVIYNSVWILKYRTGASEVLNVQPSLLRAKNGILHYCVWRLETFTLVCVKIESIRDCLWRFWCLALVWDTCDPFLLCAKNGIIYYFFVVDWTVYFRLGEDWHHFTLVCNLNFLYCCVPLENECIENVEYWQFWWIGDECTFASLHANLNTYAIARAYQQWCTTLEAM